MNYVARFCGDRSIPRARQATRCSTRSFTLSRSPLLLEDIEFKNFPVFLFSLSLSPSLLTVQWSQWRQRCSRYCCRPGHDDTRTSSERGRRRRRRATLLLWRSNKSDHRRHSRGAPRRTRRRQIDATARVWGHGGAGARRRGRERGERPHTIEERGKMKG